MSRILDNPFLVFVVALAAQWGAAFFGDLLRRRVRPIVSGERDDLNTVLAGTLTLLGLIIGFSFSMAVSRYDQRKSYEETEANAIGTEFVRADLLPADDGAKLRELLVKYVDARIAFYGGGTAQPGVTDGDDAKLQSTLWSTVTRVAATQPTPIVSLAVAGMNDVLNAQGYTQAAWRNRIPIAAWALLGVIAILSNVLLGYREKRTDPLVLVILPVTISIAFFLIADIDSPGGGIIRVAPHNLIAEAQAMKTR